jgi:AraC-like DNA-binding protein
MRLTLACILAVIFSIEVLAVEQLELRRMESSHYIFMRFEDYHVKFNELKPIFLKEVHKQNLQANLTGEPFNLYFSDHDWAIGCLINEDIKTNSPLSTGFLDNSHATTCIYNGENQNLDNLLSLMSSFFETKGYKWHGPLILIPIKTEKATSDLKVVIPVSRNVYKLWKKPKGAIKVIIVFICLILAIFLFSYEKGRKISNLILGIFALLCFFQNSNSLLWIYEINQKWPHLYNFSMPFNYLFGPLILFYTKSIIQVKFSFKKFETLHLVPFLLMAITYLFVYQFQDTEIKYELMLGGFKDILLIKFFYKFYHIQVLSYLIISLTYLFVKKPGIVKINPSLMQNVLSTLKIFLTGMIIIQTIVFIENNFHLSIKNDWLYLSIVETTSTLIFVSIIIVRVLSYPEIFTFSLSESNGKKYEKSPLNEEHKQYYLKKLIRYMEDKKPYLSSEINLSTLAKETAIPSRYLSQVLNEKMGLSFYDFINKYRIKEATNLLSDPTNSDSSIIDIAYECGFNSKSVFNASFKKNTGRTPKEYRESNLAVSTI